MTLHLPAISARQSTFTNSVAACLAPTGLTVGTINGTLHWQMFCPPFEPVISVELSLDGVPALLLVDADPVPDLFDMPITSEELQRLPQAFQASLLEAVLADLIGQSAVASGLSIEPRSLQRGTSGSHDIDQGDRVDLGWRFVDDDNQQRLAGCLRLMPQTAGRISQRLAASGPGPGALAVGRLALDPLIVIGTSALSRSEITAIEPGDVVLVQNHRWDESLATITICDELRYVVRADDGELTVVTQEGADLVSEFDEEPSDDTVLTDINEVALPVSFDLGRLELSVGELAQVAEGYLFNLQRPLESLVSLRVNGRLIGRGELVDIEGSLGVRVTEILATNNG